MCKGILKKKTDNVLEQYIKRATETHKNRYNYDKTKYVNRGNKIIITCLKHGDFTQRASAHLEGQGCPICKKSKGELKIENWLNSHNIKYASQKIFADCRGKRYPLRYDFFLPEHNTCIEYDGPHHFSNSFFIKDLKLNEQKYQQTVLYDKIKNEYCLNKGINLIRIKYNQSINSTLSFLRTQNDHN